MIAFETIKVEGESLLHRWLPRWLPNWLLSSRPNMLKATKLAVLLLRKDFRNP